MQNASELIEQAKATRARLQWVRGAPASPAPSAPAAPEEHPSAARFSQELIAELSSPPKHSLYSELMKKHDTIHPRR